MSDLKYIARSTAWGMFSLRNSKKRFAEIVNSSASNKGVTDVATAAENVSNTNCGKVFWVTLLIDVIYIIMLAADVLAGLGGKENVLGIVLLLVSLIIYTMCYFYATRLKYYFYDDHILKRTKFFTIQETNIAFFGVLEVGVIQNFSERLIGCGVVRIDYVGQYSIDNEIMVDIAKPKKLRKYLLSQIARERDINKIITN